MYYNVVVLQFCFVFVHTLLLVALVDFIFRICMLLQFVYDIAQSYCMKDRTHALLKKSEVHDHGSFYVRRSSNFGSVIKAIMGNAVEFCEDPTLWQTLSVNCGN